MNLDQLIIDCSAFERNSDGSWTVTRDTKVSVGPGPAGASMGLKAGAKVVLTEYIFNGVPLVRALDHQCAKQSGGAT